MTMTNETQFDFSAFRASINALLELKKDHKASRDAMRITEGKAELAVLFAAIDYGTKAYDLQPLAHYVVAVKPSALIKRIIKATFPTFDFALIGDDKRAAFVHTDGLDKSYDAAKLQLLADAYASGDSVTCDQIKAAFPEPTQGKADKLAKLGKAIAARMKADNLSKADIAAILKAL